MAFIELHRERARSRWFGILPRALTRDGVVFAQHVREGRLQRGLAFVAGASSVLAGIEVGFEHYRGSYSQRKMYTPVVASSALLAAGLAGTFDRRAARTLLPAVSLLTLADGVWGFVYHVRGVARKPGGWRLPVFNITMGPPLFAPLLFGVSGFIGAIASLLRRVDDPRDRGLPRWARPRSQWRALIPLVGARRRRGGRGGLSLAHEVREGRFQKHLAGATAFWSFLSGAEALYSHYKNNFRYKMQWTPVVLAPALMGASLGAIFSRRVARTALPVASALALADGALGFFYHARGVVRRPGGTRHLTYNILYGPPPFAPLLFGACGFLGLLASLLRRERS